MKTDVQEQKWRDADAKRTSEVARVANGLQQSGLTRTEALRMAEKFVRHVL